MFEEKIKMYKKKKIKCDILKNELFATENRVNVLQNNTQLMFDNATGLEINKLENHSRELKKEIIELEKDINEVEIYLDLLNEEDAFILSKRYIDGLKWDVISRQMKLSVPSLFSHKNKSLRYINEILKSRYN